MLTGPSETPPISAMKARLGISTVRTRAKAGLVTNASSPAARSCSTWARLMRLAIAIPAAIQKGKKPAAGPSSSQPKPMRLLS